MKICFSDSALKIKILATLGLKCERVQGYELRSRSREGVDRDLLGPRAAAGPLTWAAGGGA